MKNPAVTVIIPMFNTEEFIAECLSSLLNQTFQNFEVIVADDCSTDNSRAVVQKISADFNGKLKMLKLSKNSGRPGIPRNFALDAARGKYIFFLDSDDLLSENALENFFNVAESFQADVVHAEKCVSFVEEDGQIYSEVISNQTGDFVTEPTLETFDFGERVTDFTRKRYLWWACNKLFRRKFLVDNKIKFPATSVFEDFVFAFMCLVVAKNYVRVPFVSYHYRRRENSMSKKDVIVGEKFMDDLIGNVKQLTDFMFGQRFFVDNPVYVYSVTDFFMQHQFENFTNAVLFSPNYDLGTVYNFLVKDVFAHKKKDTVALTAYLFVAANIFKLFSTQQAAEIDDLKRQLAALKK